MIQKLSHATVHVLDQDRALRFYRDQLGFEVRTDAVLGGFRWLTVGPKSQPELEIILMPVAPSPMMDEATAGTLRELDGTRPPQAHPITASGATDPAAPVDAAGEADRPV